MIMNNPPTWYDINPRGYQGTYQFDILLALIAKWYTTPQSKQQDRRFFFQIISRFTFHIVESFWKTFINHWKLFLLKYDKLG